MLYVSPGETRVHGQHESDNTGGEWSGSAGAGVVLSAATPVRAVKYIRGYLEV